MKRISNLILLLGGGLLLLALCACSNGGGEVPVVPGDFTLTGVWESDEIEFINNPSGARNEYTGQIRLSVSDSWIIVETPYGVSRQMTYAKVGDGFYRISDSYTEDGPAYAGTAILRLTASSRSDFLTNTITNLGFVRDLASFTEVTFRKVSDSSESWPEKTKSLAPWLGSEDPDNPQDPDAPSGGDFTLPEGKEPDDTVDTGQLELIRLDLSHAVDALVQQASVNNTPPGVEVVGDTLNGEIYFTDASYVVEGFNGVEIKLNGRMKITTDIGAGASSIIEKIVILTDGTSVDGESYTASWKSSMINYQPSTTDIVVNGWKLPDSDGV